MAQQYPPIAGGPGGPGKPPGGPTVAGSGRVYPPIGPPPGAAPAPAPGSASAGGLPPITAPRATPVAAPANLPPLGATGRPAAPDEDPRAVAGPALRTDPARAWPARLLGAGLAALLAVLVIVGCCWLTLLVPVPAGEGGLSGPGLLRALWTGSADAPPTMASLAFGTALAVACVAAVATWLATAGQGLRGVPVTLGGVATTMTVAVLVLGFCLASGWRIVAPWLVEVVGSTEPAAAVGFDTLVLWGLACAAALGGWSANVGTDRRGGLTAGLVLALVIALLGALAGGSVLLTGQGSSGYSIAWFVAAGLGAPGVVGLSAWAVLLSALAAVGLAPVAARQARVRGAGRIAASTVALLVLASGTAVAVLLLTLNQRYQAESGADAGPLTPYLPVTWFGLVALAIASALLLLQVSWSTRTRPVSDKEGKP